MPLRRAFGMAVEYAKRFRTGHSFGVRTLLVDGDGRVVLVKHTYIPGWHLPGGGVELFETAEDAARREAAEEAGVTLTGPLTLFGLYGRFTAGYSDQVAVYVGRAWTIVPPAPNSEIAAVTVAAMDALPEGTSAPTLRRLAEFRGEAVPGPLW